MITERPRDIEDVEAILLKNPEYDSRYIEKWLEEFDLALDRNYRENFLDLKKDLNSADWYNGQKEKGRDRSDVGFA